ILQQFAVQMRTIRDARACIKTFGDTFWSQRIAAIFPNPNQSYRQCATESRCGGRRLPLPSKIRMSLKVDIVERYPRPSGSTVGYKNTQPSGVHHGATHA